MEIDVLMSPHVSSALVTPAFQGKYSYLPMPHAPYLGEPQSLHFCKVATWAAVIRSWQNSKTLVSHIYPISGLVTAATDLWLKGDTSLQESSHQATKASFKPVLNFRRNRGSE